MAYIAENTFSVRYELNFMYECIALVVNQEQGFGLESGGGGVLFCLCAASKNTYILCHFPVINILI